jgi:hypothetical protein
VKPDGGGGREQWQKAAAHPGSSCVGEGMKLMGGACMSGAGKRGGGMGRKAHLQEESVFQHGAKGTWAD